MEIPPIGQLFLMGFPGETLSSDAKRLLQTDGIGGTILFSRNIQSAQQVVELNTEIVNACSPEYPALISVDQEGGRVARLRGICTDIPDMRTVGRASVDNPDLPYRLGAMMARELSALGFHLDFAPVIDVDTNPDNPVIGERAFSHDPFAVAEHGVQFIRGMQQAGVAACGKHFPGHGDTDTDSHFLLPQISHPLSRLEAVELEPFRAAVAAQVASIMTAHVMFPALDRTLPATLSPHILKDLLRKRLGFEGVIISDDLEMKALADHFSIEEMVVKGLQAGVDLFLICHQSEWVERALEATKRALTDGDLSVDRVQEAIGRVTRLKERFIGQPAPPSLEAATAMLKCAPHLSTVAQIPPLAAQATRECSPVDTY